MMNPSSLEVQYLHEQLAVIYPRSLGFLPDEEHRMPTDEKVWRQRDFFNNLAGMTLEERERLHREMMENVFLSPLYVPPKTRESEKLLRDSKLEAGVKEASAKTKFALVGGVVDKNQLATTPPTKKLFGGSGTPIDKSKVFSDRPRFGSAGKQRIPSTPEPESSIGMNILKVGLAEVAGFFVARFFNEEYQPFAASSIVFREPKPKET